MIVFFRLIMGKPLGEGAFGIVIKSMAVGIGGKNGQTPVALKMLKGNLINLRLPGKVRKYNSY